MYLKEIKFPEIKISDQKIYKQRTFNGFETAKFVYSGLVLGLSQFSLLHQPPQK